MEIISTRITREKIRYFEHRLCNSNNNNIDQYKSHDIHTTPVADVLYISCDNDEWKNESEIVAFTLTYLKSN